MTPQSQPQDHAQAQAQGMTRRTALGLGGVVAGAAFVAPQLSMPRASADPSWPFYLGLNASGLETGGVVPGTANVNYAVPTAANFDYYRLRGFTRIRLPFKWERIQPTLGGALDATYLGYLTTLADYAATQGMRVLLDCHNYGRYAGQALGTSSTPTTALADLWTRLAQVFVGHAGVDGYDLMNEPHDMPTATAWPDAAQAAVAAIRTVDTGTTIYVEGDGWSSAPAWPVKNANLLITDPSDNLVYSAHMYYDRDSSGTHQDWDEEVAAGDQLQSPTAPLTVDTGANRIAAFAGWLQAHGVRGHIGETGAPNTHPNWLVALDRTLTYCRDHDIPVSYWAAGPFFKNYVLGVEPNAGKDTVQMAVLTKYSGGAQPTQIYLSGPNRGVVAAASTPFTIDYRGYLTSTVKVTPKDGNVGGTFSPAFVYLQPGFNGLATFTYTPSQVRTAALTTVNTASFANPEPVGYSTRTDAFSAIPDAALLNVLATSRLFTPFVGTAVRLRRSSDGAEKDFGHTTNDTLETSAITTWAAGSTVSVVRLGDQSPSRGDAGPVVTSNQQGVGGTRLESSPADYPTLVLNALNGQPVMRFAASRMDAPAPVAGLTGFTCFVVAKPTTLAGMQRLLSWVVTDHLIIGNSTGGWEMSGESPAAQALGVAPGAWHIYAVRWQAGGSRTSWIDGTQVATAPATGASIPMAHETRVNIGYFRWYKNVYFAGDVYGMFPFRQALSDPQMADLWAGLSAKTGIAVA